MRRPLVQNLLGFPSLSRAFNVRFLDTNDEWHDEQSGQRAEENKLVYILLAMSWRGLEENGFKSCRGNG